MSVDKGLSESLDIDQQRKFEGLLEDLTDDFKIGTGTYEGELEQSYLFSNVGPALLVHLRALANKFNQDCIFVCDDNGSSPKLIGSGFTTIVGSKLVTSSVKPSGDYTQIGDTFYIVV